MQNVNEKGVRDSLRLFVISLALMCIFAGRQGFSQSVTITDGIINTAFQSGETAQYDLYYNWKFMWVKAGTGSTGNRKRSVSCRRRHHHDER